MLWRRDLANDRFNLSLIVQLGGDGFAFGDMTFTNSSLLNVVAREQYDTYLDTWELEVSDYFNQINRTSLPYADRTDTLTRLSSDGDTYFVRGDVAGSRLVSTKTPTSQNIEGLVDGSAVFNPQGNSLAIANAQNIRIFSKIAF